MTIFSTFPACYLRTPLCLMINDPLLTIQTKFFHSHLCSSYLKYFLSIFVTWVIFSKELIESLIFRKLQLMQIRIFFFTYKTSCVFRQEMGILAAWSRDPRIFKLRSVFLLWHFFVMLFTGKKFKGSKRGTGKETTRKLGDSSTRNSSNDRGQHGNANFANEVI